MSRRIEKHELSPGRVVFIRVQSAFEYLDLQEKLNALDDAKDAEADVAARMKAGMALKFAASICDEAGNLLHPEDGARIIDELGISWPESKALADAINLTNGVSPRALEATEKK